MRTPPVALIAALGGALLTQGCAVLGAAGAASLGVVAVQDRTMGEGIDDAMASNTIKSRLMMLDRAGYSAVDVEVAAGRLLLSGYAPTEQHRDAAELVARNASSIREVFNEIQVGPPDTWQRSTQDEFITAQVRTRLIASRAVRGVNVNIETHRGTVYLLGLARTEEELQRAAEITSTVSGVSRVVSLMTVRERYPTLEEAQAFAPRTQQTAGTPY